MVLLSYWRISLKLAQLLGSQAEIVDGLVEYKLWKEHVDGHPLEFS